MRHKIFSYLFTLIGAALIVLPLVIIVLDAEFRSPGMLGRVLQIAALPMGFMIAFGFGMALISIGYVIRRDNKGDQNEH